MASKFKKLDKVALIQSWDSKGTVSIRRATVQASGAKVTRLMDLNGEMFKVAMDTDTVPLFADASDAELEAIALAKAEVILASQRAHYDRCLAGGHGEGYDRAIRRGIEALHEPRVIWR